MLAKTQQTCDQPAPGTTDHIQATPIPTAEIRLR